MSHLVLHRQPRVESGFVAWIDAFIGAHSSLLDLVLWTHKRSSACGGEYNVERSRATCRPAKPSLYQTNDNLRASTGPAKSTTVVERRRSSRPKRPPPTLVLRHISVGDCSCRQTPHAQNTARESTPVNLCRGSPVERSANHEVRRQTRL